MASRTPPLPEQPARLFDDSLTRLVRHDVGNVAPFLVFMMGLPFVGVATHTGCVGSLGFGLKRLIKTVRIEGGSKVVYRVKTTAKGLPRCCWDAEQDDDGEIEIELPVYGVDYTAYDVDNGAREVERMNHRPLL